MASPNLSARPWRHFARQSLGRALAGVEREATTAIERVKPLVSPFIERLALRVTGKPEADATLALRALFDDYVRRVLQASGVVMATVQPSSPQRLAPGMEHLTRLVERRSIQIQRLWDFERARDPVEAVHQLRVASRRLRAFVDMFEPFVEPRLVERARSRLRRITRAVRDLRDADVQTEHLRQRIARASSKPERVALDHLLDRVKRKRAAHARKGQQALARIQPWELFAALRAMLDQLALRSTTPSANYELIAEVAFEPVLEAARDACPRVVNPSAEELHRFRLALKRLRYSAELIQPVLGERYGEHHGRAKQLQTLLGHHQDSVQFERLVAKRYQKTVRTKDQALAASLWQVLEHARQEREDLDQRCRQECTSAAQPRLFALGEGATE